MNFEDLWSLNILASALMLMGMFFIITAVVGLIRFPDFLTKIHAISISDSLGVPLFLCGAMLLNGYNLATLKIAIIILLIYLVNPMITMEIGSYFINKKSEGSDD